MERILSVDFALIPVGKLSPGRYHVTLTQIPMSNESKATFHRSLDEEWSKRFLCKPFFFNITDEVNGIR